MLEKDIDEIRKRTYNKNKRCFERWVSRMKNKSQILIVDDSKLNRASLSDILKDGYEILEAENGKEALEILESHVETIAVIILDLVMPVMDGFGFLEKFGENEAYKYIPVIVTTGSDDVESEKRCLKLGVWDFIPKKFHPDIIHFRVLNAIQKSKIDVLKYDLLTGIYNEQNFYLETREMLDRHKEQTFAVIHYDVDRFKMINSLYGAAEGDHLICQVAKAIDSVLEGRDATTYGRISGDIFAICMSYDKKQEIEEVLQEIDGNLKRHETPYYLETSAGIYLLENNDWEVPIICDKAAIAARRCKGQYLLHAAFYTPEMGLEMLREQKIIDEMDTALQENQFVVYYQPKYEVKTGRPYGAEALVRWQKEDGSFVSPGEFIPIFEKNGFITRLDYYVWEKVCQFIRSELDEGREPAPISVNVSRVNLYTPKFLETIVDLVEKYKVPPHYLYLELTETVFSDSEKLIREAVDNLHKVGFTIMMDDFGSGYSSLNVLKDIHLDIIKIDREFLPRSEEDIRSEKILEAIIRMANSLKLPIVVEGVEEAHQVELLSRLGCDYIQGYYFAKPMPQAQYRDLILANGA